ncbi:ABC transporter permease [Frigidibacter sp. ROC022]|uniref:ABC transporter permease n=1 Tax=Frigidibacter sp. ROC022 TaxID=2971796 RepID=UPI00215A1AC8|nr:ABC transporter permease [Frigidibacter sp. ROC022]MCR8726118.1 ABC transporter permease [Frigidibacter sp. ROC022]
MSAASRILATSGQEIRIARRNRWALLSTLLLTLFALSLALFAAGQAGQVKADTLTLTAASLATLSVYLIPLIALLVSYDAFAGEVERGTLALTLATPLGRGEMFAGKFLGQAAVVGLAILIAFASAATVVAATGGLTAAGAIAWLRLGLTSLVLGGVFVGLGLAISAATPRTGTAAAFAVGLWLVFVVLYDIALLGAVIAAGESTFTTHVFPWLVLANPADSFRLYNLVSLDTAPVAGIDGLARTLPIPPAATLVPLFLWVTAALAAGIALVRRLTP